MDCSVLLSLLSGSRTRLLKLSYYWVWRLKMLWSLLHCRYAKQWSVGFNPSWRFYQLALYVHVYCRSVGMGFRWHAHRDWDFYRLQIHVLSSLIAWCTFSHSPDYRIAGNFGRLLKSLDTWQNLLWRHFGAHSVTPLIKNQSIGDCPFNNEKQQYVRMYVRISNTTYIHIYIHTYDRHTYI